MGSRRHVHVQSRSRSTCVVVVCAAVFGVSTRDFAYTVDRRALVVGSNGQCLAFQPEISHTLSIGARWWSAAMDSADRSCQLPCHCTCARSSAFGVEQRVVK